MTTRTCYIVHRRTPFEHHGENEFYMDRTARESYTVCGADPTAQDVEFHERLERREREDGAVFLPCSECLRRSTKGTPC